MDNDNSDDEDVVTDTSMRGARNMKDDKPSRREALAAAKKAEAERVERERVKARGAGASLKKKTRFVRQTRERSKGVFVSKQLSKQSKRNGFEFFLCLSQ